MRSGTFSLQDECPISTPADLSPPSLHERNDASTYHGNNDDGRQRFRRCQDLVPFAPKLQHALASIERAPITAIQSVGRTNLCDRECNGTFRRARFDRATT
jgi:hypothetical protein